MPTATSFRLQPPAGQRRIRQPTARHSLSTASASTASIAPGAVYHETATIVTHDQGIPIASRVCNEEGGERAAALALLEDLNIAGATITMDALHTTRQTADRIVRTHRAHYLFSVKGNAPETFQTLQSIDWEQEATATFSETSEKEHGRVDRRHIACLSPLKRAINFPHVKQIFRVERHRYEIKTGKTSVEHAYGITSLPASEASPEKLLCLNRRHGSIENKNHRRRDTAFLEDGCLMRSGNGPANNAVFKQHGARNHPQRRIPPSAGRDRPL